MSSQQSKSGEQTEQPLFPRPQRTFQALPEALDFLATCLETNAVFPLLAEVRNAPKARPSAPPPSADRFKAAFEQLRSVHTQHSLQELYADASFPDDEDHYRLDGYLARTADIDVQFVRLPQGWVLADIEFL